MRRYVHKKAPVKVEPADMQKARRLPMPGPGIKVRIPLHLLPAYLELYSLEPMDGQGFPLLGPALTLKVKRIKKEKKEG
jgi:hypothetical protein